ncbi:hypothetical protein OAE83_01780, partial [bacterium]|nr:hypothetical protein [bacterium]
IVGKLDGNPRKHKIMKFFASLLAITLFTPLAVIADQALPIGSTLDYKKGMTDGTAITPDGRRVKVELTDYDQWWLGKSDSEQSAWLDLWLKTVQTIAAKHNPNLTFVLFMTDVMNNKLQINDLRIVDMAQIKSKKILPYAVEVAKYRCDNYRSGMSFDEGRDQAEKLLSNQAKREMLQVMTLGSDDRQPTVIGLLKYATDVNSAVNRECNEELSRAYSKGSAYDK